MGRIEPLEALNASRLEREQAFVALEKGERETSWQLLWQSASRLSLIEHRECQINFLSVCLELSDLAFSRGRRFDDLLLFLQNALDISQKLGDKRSHALINLHLGRFYDYADQKQKAVKTLELGIKQVEKINDEDIRTRAYEFYGLYYFIQGYFNEAKPYFEKASKNFEKGNLQNRLNPSGPIYLSYCEAFLGRFHNAIGTLDYYRRMASEISDNGLAINLRARLGIILTLYSKIRDASYHLFSALKEAEQTENIFAKYIAIGGIAYIHYKKGKPEKARKWLVRALSEGSSAGIIRSYRSPILLELLFEFYNRNVKNIPGLSFKKVYSRIMLEPNVHMKGVGIRLNALNMKKKGTQISIIMNELDQSTKYLQQSGDPIQLGKTHIAKARLMLEKGSIDKAVFLCQKAWKGFSGHEDIFYPDDLRQLLISKPDDSLQMDDDNESINSFMSMVEELVPSVDINHLLNRMVALSNRFFGAERGCIFKFDPEPEIIGLYNLSKTDIETNAFIPSMNLMRKVLETTMPKVLRNDHQAIISDHPKTAIAIPFLLKGQLKGVLYHDNSYILNAFARFEPFQLDKISKAIGDYIEQVFIFQRVFVDGSKKNITTVEQQSSSQIITHSSKMKKMLLQLDQISKTDSTVLLLGKTGVGKELAARRLHDKSLRNKGPFIILDPTSIPETLFESELFGHEKGAFTGALKQKKGRIEIADQGTLFIDEVGEIPLTTQVKFLRVLQEKTITRVGGTKVIVSNFRLIAATNRNLTEEVAKGKFREDLFYRLNVIPVTLPELKDRGDDILLLAKYFLHRYSLKYNQTKIVLSLSNESELQSYHWPGNIRELKNVIERAVLLSDKNQLQFDFTTLPVQETRDHPFDDMPTLNEVQRRYIEYILKKTKGKLSGPDSASEILKINRTSLYNRMKKLDMK